MLIHIVQAGDTLSAIAQQYGVSVSRLLLDNGLNLMSQLVVGQALLVTLPSVTHTVRGGDTLTSIAAAYGITAIELMQNNPNLILTPVIYPGQDLAIAFRGGKRRTVSTSGYAYPFINRNTLRLALPYLTYLAIFSYGFRESGELIPIDDNELIRLAYEYRVAPVMVLTTITEEGHFSGEKAEALLSDIGFQNRVLDNIIETMREKGYLGLDVDFEFIPPEQSEAYVAFLRNAHDRLQANGFFMSVALAPKTHADQPGLLYEAHNYPVIGAIADNVLIMTYEWGYTFGPPMAVAPINAVRSVVSYAVTEIPPDKILMGIPNYGYDWTLPYERGISRALGIGNQEAVVLAAQNRAEIRFDPVAMSPYFNYSSGGARHVVWFEDIRSIEAKMNLADEFQLLGVGYWQIMKPFAQNYMLLAVRYGVRKVV
ncbi:MAG: LysM peptidoglycan-binding domain-containing protein [Eubacteriales bacterium]